MKLIKWLKSSVEGKDGRSSARALTNFWYVFLNTFIVFHVAYEIDKIIAKESLSPLIEKVLWVEFWVFVILNATVLIIFGIVTIQNLTELTKAVKGVSSPVEVETNTKTVTTLSQKLIDENPVE